MNAASYVGPLITRAKLVQDLTRLGVREGTPLVVHSSLSKIGWVVGGATSVVQALMDVVGESGTLILPAATPQCADPAQWGDPRLPEAWLPTIRDHLPPFEVTTTPTSLGAIPETFRTWPGTRRSDHPLESVCAWGKNAALVTDGHPLAFSEGPGSPFGRAHDLGASILLLGVGFNRCTALHYAETLAPKRRLQTVRFPKVEDSERVWYEVENVADDNGEHFPNIGARFREQGKVVEGSVGAAPCFLFTMSELVASALDYFDAHLPPGEGV